MKVRAWLSRVAWAIRGRRNVRIQLENNKGAIDGVLLGVVAGHYRLINAYLYEQNPKAEGIELIGETWIPKHHVVMLQVKKS